MWRFKTLQQRLNVLLILPVALFILGIGLAGYIYLRDSLLTEWQENAILRLERAAHQLDMRLNLPLSWMEAYAQAGGDPRVQEIQAWVLQQIKAQPGVVEVKLQWQQPGAGQAGIPPAEQIGPPQYFYPSNQAAVGLRRALLDARGHPLGQMEVILKTDYLLQDILTTGWLYTHMACLVNLPDGLYLAHADPSMQSQHCLTDSRHLVEQALLQTMRGKHYGTILEPGWTPDQVIGFYRLHTAPWAIMLHARGSQILALFLRFRLYYLGAMVLCLVVLLVLIRMEVKPLVASIRRMAERAALVAQGHYGEPLPVASRDEIGRLTRDFNEMVEGLKERDFISNTFGRYVDREIAQELLSRPEVARLGGEKREVVILFSDIRGFTPLAETLTPEATIHLVNRHFSRMIDIIQQHHGIIVDFLGDAILAFFDPLDGPLGPVVRRGLECALKMQAAQEEDNADQPDSMALQLGVGLHVGEVVVGNIGSETRAKYGIVGSAVNLTHRIQAQARGGEVILSASAYQYVEDAVRVKTSSQPQLKGIQEPVTLYVVENLKE
jgi:class 3 adenylate cyclase